MVVGTVLAAAMVMLVDVATVGVVLVGLVSAAAFAVRMRRRRASQPGGGYAGGPGAAGGSADPSASVSRAHDRWHHLMGDLEANLDDDQVVADHSVDGSTGSLLALPPAVADHSADGPTGSLLALPPAATRAAPDADGHPASHTLERVHACLNAASTPQVVAPSVIDSTGRVLAGATDDDV